MSLTRAFVILFIVLGFALAIGAIGAASMGSHPTLQQPQILHYGGSK